MNPSKNWYVVKRDNGHCEILADELEAEPKVNTNQAVVQRWGPFDSQDEAIARRIGLIRAGRCQPVQSTQ